MSSRTTGGIDQLEQVLHSNLGVPLRWGNEGQIKGGFSDSSGCRRGGARVIKAGGVAGREDPCERVSKGWREDGDVGLPGGLTMERPIHILFAGPRDRYSDLLRRLHGRYAVHQARDDAAVVEIADQARTAGKPETWRFWGPTYRCWACGHGRAVATIAPTTPLITLLLPPAGAVPPGPFARRAAGIWSSRWTPGGIDGWPRRAGGARGPRGPAAFCGGRPAGRAERRVLRQPDLVSALRALYQQLAGLVRADYFYVALY